MDCLTRTINKLKLLVILLLSFLNSYTQKCPISSMSYEPFVFSNNGLISTLYNQIKIDDSSSCNIMYVIFLYQVNKKEAYCLSIDKHKNFTIKAVTTDSVVFSGCMQTTGKYDIDVILDAKLINGYLTSECNYVVSSHRKSMLLLFNHTTHKWVEYVSMDGYMKEAFQENKQYDFLQKCYNLLEAVFHDVNVTILK